MTLTQSGNGKGQGPGGHKPNKRLAVAFIAIGTAGVLIWAFGLAPSAVKRDFAWFDTLGFPDVKGRKCVRVSTGRFYQIGGNAVTNSYIEGFLLGQSTSTFTVFTKDLETMTFQRTDAGTPAPKVIDFEPIDLRKSATAHLNSSNAVGMWLGLLGPSLREPTQTFVLGWACERHGLHKLAEELYRKAIASLKTGGKKQLGWSEIRDRLFAMFRKRGKTFREKVEEQIGELLMWRATLAFGEPRISRSELLKRFEEIVQKYPRCKYATQAKGTASILRRMVLEDEAYASKLRKPISEMTVEERVTQLIYQLRDQNGRQFSQPGSCDIFNDPSGDESPAHQLLKLGYRAVPQLLEGIESTTFTRSIGFHRDFYFSHNVLSVGDCAVAILDRIAGRYFWREAGGNSTRVKEAAQAWWKEFKEKGEKLMLVEGTERGDDDSPEQATMLAERYPDLAASAIEKGAVRCTNAWTRSRLVELTSSSAFLLEEVRKGPTLATRLAAAGVLQKQGREEGVKGMIEEWNGLGPNPSADGNWDVDNLVRFLAESGSADAIRALEGDLAKRSISVRCDVISSLGSAKATSEVVSNDIERLLAGELEDTDERIGMSGTYGDKSFSDPRLCDLAGHSLWELWPQKYSFDIAATRKVRERQRIECLNVWRAQNGIRILPLPEWERAPSVDTARAQALLLKLREATSEKDRQKAMLALGSLGPGAIPILRKSTTQPMKGESKASAFAVLEKMLACTVTEIKFTKDASAPDVGLGPVLANLTNAPFDAARFVQVPLQVAKGWRAHAVGILMRVTRDEDLTGVTVEISLTTNRVFQAGTQKGWSTFERVTLGNDDIHNSAGSCSLDYAASVENWKELISAIESAVNSAPEVPFVINLSMTREE